MTVVGTFPEDSHAPILDPVTIRTLPAAIYGFAQVPGGQPQALRLTLIAVAFATAALVASELIVRRIRDG